MNKVMLSLATVLLFTLAAFSQTSTTEPSGAQGTQNSSPAMQETPQTGNSGMNGSTANTSQKKIKGCVAQQNGQYVLETKHGAIPLSGQDVSAHVGHTVALHGTWTSSAAGTPSSTTSTQAAGQGFDVTKVDMISESCNMKGNMGAGSSGTTPQQ